MKYDARACKFNMDTGCVELTLQDGRKISIDCTGVEDALDVTMAQQTELDYLIYNDPQRVKGFSPLTIPKMRSKPKNASRFAKRIFLCFSHLRLRRRFHLSAGLYALRGRNTRCEAANRRNEKKALSAATSFFPFRQLLRDYQGRAALDSCLPRLESSGCFSGSLLARKRELSPNATAL